jgi:hypothetical protein
VILFPNGALIGNRNGTVLSYKLQSRVNMM